MSGAHQVIGRGPRCTIVVHDFRTVLMEAHSELWIDLQLESGSNVNLDSSRVSRHVNELKCSTNKAKYRRVLVSFSFFFDYTSKLLPITSTYLSSVQMFTGTFHFHRVAPLSVLNSPPAWSVPHLTLF